MKPSPLQEQDGAWSMRRTLALIAFLNASALSWRETSWQIIALWIAAALILLGLTTVQEIKALAQYRTADAVGGASVDGQTDEPIGFKG